MSADFHWMTTLAQDGAPPPPPEGDGGDAGTQQPADGAAPGQPTGQPGGGSEFIFMMVLILVIFWVLLIIPQRREKKKRAQMMSDIKKGDRIQTVGGVLGTIVELREHEVVLKVDESTNTRMRFTRGAIHSVLTDGKPEDDDAKK